jgi:hypothetical protein
MLAMLLLSRRCRGVLSLLSHAGDGMLSPLSHADNGVAKATLAMVLPTTMLM